jgi:hypothetical protein
MGLIFRIVWFDDMNVLLKSYRFGRTSGDISQYIWKEMGISFSLNVIIVYQQVSGKRTINGHDVTGPGQFRLVVSLDLGQSQ